MNLKFFIAVFATPFLFAGVSPSEQDVPRSRDRLPFIRVPGYFIERYDTSFDEGRWFLVANGKRTEKRMIKGRKTYIVYRLKSGLKPISPIDVIRNQQNTIKSVGGDVLFEKKVGVVGTTLRVRNGDVEMWAYVISYAGGSCYHLMIVERNEKK